MNFPEMVAFIATVVTVAVTVSVSVVFAGPGGRWIRRIDREVSAERNQLRADLEEMQGRMAEMEERLEFTERLLAQRPPAGRLEESR